MTEAEFLQLRQPFWLEGENLFVSMPSNSDRNDVHSHLCKKYGYGWMFALRGYWIPNSHIQLYIGDYETPNMSIMVIQYLFSYFKDIKYIGLGCNKGKPGEIWDAKVYIPRNKEYLNSKLFDNDILNK